MLGLIKLEFRCNGALQTVDEICPNTVKKQVSGRVSGGFLQAYVLRLCRVRDSVGKKQLLCRCWCAWLFTALLTKLDGTAEADSLALHFNFKHLLAISTKCHCFWSDVIYYIIVFLMVEYSFQRDVKMCMLRLHISQSKWLFLKDFFLFEMNIWPVLSKHKLDS